ncbi:MAG: hypothetical protein ACTSR8_03195 [Promethearchaeota archaeon]
MLFVSDYDLIPEPARSIIIILQIILAIGCFIISILAIYSFKKKDPNMSKTYFFGIPLFFLLVGVARLILIYHDFYASDEYDLSLWAIANVIILLGFIILNYIIETQVYTKSKHIFTILGITLTSLYAFAVIFFEKIIASLTLYVAIASQFIPISCIYLIVAKQGAGVVKKRATIIISGIIIVIISQATGIFELMGLMDRISSSLFGPPTALVGLCFLAYGLVSMSN